MDDVRSVSALQILVQLISLCNQFLLPLSESLLLNLDLLGESLPQTLFFLLELGVIKFPRSSFTELPRLHLLSTVGFVVHLLGCVDQVKHVCADEDGSEFLEVAVVFVLNLGDTPGVLATLDNASIAGLDILFGADNSEWHGGHERTGVLGSGLVVFLDRWLVDLDSLSFDDRSDLISRKVSFRPHD
jgi:hypothetical protein